MSFDSLGLRAELLRAVSDQGYSEPTPIQRQAIPVILEGRDILAGAQTGTGKTAGFTLPLLQRLSTTAQAGGRKPIRALILTPTRELAAQVEESVVTYGKHLALTSTVVFGGVSINPQISKLRKGVDVLVATPGRLLDHIGQKTLDLSQVEILVLDEADRMLDMGFIRDIRKILALLPKGRQNLLFSATFSEEIKQLSDGILSKPVLIEVARRNTATELVSQVVHPVDRERKRELLSHLIGTNDWRQVLVFTRTKHGANRLAEQLGKDGITAAAIHGNKSQGARTKALADFKAGNVRVLVATDIAARGLDIDQLPHVVNFELPNVAEDYVHRIGRTGRAGNEGEALSLVCVDEDRLLRDIERLIKRDISKVVVDGYLPDPRIKAEPIPNGRNGRAGGRSSEPRNASPAKRRPQGQGQGRSRDGEARRSTGSTAAPRRGAGVASTPRRGAGATAAPRRADGNRPAGNRGEADGNRSQSPRREARPEVDGNRAPQRSHDREVPALFGGNSLK
ncbi:MAG: DEAD/DEAH box helicase [Gammaproteobacteria bacterium]|nr:DEAD/DEAH box helicase [Gammaproteobacteria bacterium]